jgi:carbamoyltransferase
MKLLGISLMYHDNNISYFDGEKLYYHKFERTKQEKHFWYETTWEIIKDAEKLFNFNIKDIDEVAIDYDPTFFNGGKQPDGFEELKDHDKNYYLVPDHENIFAVHGIKKLWHLNHHYAHAMSTWMIEKENKTPSTRIVIDGVGQGRTYTVFKNDKIVRYGIIENGSIGLTMGEIGPMLGINSHNIHDNAGKIMGLQSYGTIDNVFLNKTKKYSIDEINEVFNFERWIKHKGDLLLAAHTKLDWIKTIHEAVGDLIVNLFSEYANKNDLVSYSGGVAQNVVWNTKILRKFPNLIVAPHSSDEGTSLGAIEFLRKLNNLPKFTLENFPYSQNDNKPKDEPTEETIKTIAKILSEGKIVGWYQGNGEVGPRALGNRSILIDPRIKDGKRIINTVKNREFYRPFGASILSEHVKDYFEFDNKDPYMLFTNNFLSNNFPAITHIDNTCRVQTVEENSGHFRSLIEEFYKLTGCAIILNTSLNVNKKPIAGYIENAIDLFEKSPIDYMVIGNTILSKKEKGK